MASAQVETTLTKIAAQNQAHHVAETSAWADERQNQAPPRQRLLAAEGPPPDAAAELPQELGVERGCGWARC